MLDKITQGIPVQWEERCLREANTTNIQRTQLECKENTLQYSNNPKIINRVKTEMKKLNNRN